MSIRPISPRDAHALISQGAVLVDIRSNDEYARMHIPLARHVPLDRLKNEKIQPNDASAVIFHCRSGNRTKTNAHMLETCVTCDTYFLDGGLDAWRKAGLPIVTDESQPLELQRQVQIAAGTLIVLGAVLGTTVSPWFHALSGFVGAGLIFAGISGFCGLARVLMRMPWNNKMASE